MRVLRLGILILLTTCFLPVFSFSQQTSPSNEKESKKLAIKGQLLTKKKQPWKDAQVVLVPLDAFLKWKTEARNGNLALGPVRYELRNNRMILASPNSLTDQAGNFFIVDEADKLKEHGLLGTEVTIVVDERQTLKPLYQAGDIFKLEIDGAQETIDVGVLLESKK